ncbi:prephenate dehydrogenase [Rhodoluna sp.]|uniref:prephenate dehydrogenase n=1 Tax=Rhodoluna sp. TaxID=1969481 RepID=UPI0025EA12D5|nr:prephenate dehydrogenase [Rhodoluna sp.]
MTTNLGTVRIVGAGLLGTSLGLALSKLGVDVVLTSHSQKSIDLAIEYGAGRAAAESDNPNLVVVCVPPAKTAQIVAAELVAFPSAVVTDVASVKNSVLEDLAELGADLSRYVGSHPMAGRERGGAIAGRADLFVGRPWVICSTSKTTPEATKLVESLAQAVGAATVAVEASEHDRAVALVSHVPQLVSSLLAARLVAARPSDIALAGQGLRDTTRIAASDPNLWLQILEANSSEVLAVLKAFEVDLHSLVAAIESGSAQTASAQIVKVLETGNLGVERIPGKHGTKHTEYSQIVVMIDDKPGELARLLTEVGQIGVNLEELKLEHSPSAQIGLVELYVVPEAEQKLIDDLVARGWRIAG